jgi:hypothetical protein
MEGRLFHFGDDVTKAYKRAVLGQRTSRNICSLSASKTKTLLWSYYADGHKGVAIGVRVVEGKRPRVETHEVNYDSDIHISEREAKSLNPNKLAVRILSQKQIDWGHGEEHRVFSSSNFVPVQVSELVLGYSIAASDATLLTRIAEKWHPTIKISKIKPRMLEGPKAR